MFNSNAYYILGLPTSSSLKLINKRSKDIINRLKIDDLPTYDLDFPDVNKFRNEASVKKAHQSLIHPKSKLVEYFLWFQLNGYSNQEFMDAVKSGSIQKAAEHINMIINQERSDHLLNKKNLAILYIYQLSQTKDEVLLKKSLSLWKEIISSNDFWKIFIRCYKKDDDLSTTDDIISNFKTNAISSIADAYTELKEKHEDNTFIKNFSETFGAKGSKTEKKVLSPIYHNLNEAVEKLESMNISEDGVYDDDEKETINNLFEKIKEGCSKLKEIGLYEDSQSKSLRDRAVTGIRTVVLDIHNNLADMESAHSMMQFALKICGTESHRKKIEDEIRVIEKNKDNALILTPIENLFASKKYDEAIMLIDKKTIECSTDLELIKQLQNDKKAIIAAKATIMYTEGRNFLDKGKMKKAKPILEKMQEMLMGNIELFDINKETLIGIKNNIIEFMPKLNENNFDEIDNFRDHYVKLAKEKYEGEHEHAILLFLIDSFIYPELQVEISKRKSSSMSDTLIGWAVIIGLIFLVSMCDEDDKKSTKSTKSNQTQSKSKIISEYKDIEFTGLLLKFDQPRNTIYVKKKLWDKLSVEEQRKTVLTCLNYKAVKFDDKQDTTYFPFYVLDFKTNQSLASYDKK